MTAAEVKDIRLDNRMTQKEFAKALKVSYSLVCSWELSRRPIAEYHADLIRLKFCKKLIETSCNILYNVRI